MSAALLHHEHLRIIERASQFGNVVVGLTSDAALVETKGINPKLDFAARRETLMSIRHVTEVVETPWWITDEVLDQFEIDLLVHGGDNVNQVTPERLIVLPRTNAASSDGLRKK